MPSEVRAESIQIHCFDQSLNKEGLRLNNDLLQEVRKKALSQILQQKRQVVMYYNTKVKKRSFQVDALVLRKAEFTERERRHES